MKGKFLFAIICALLARSAYAAGPQALPVNTFICNGNAGTGSCPNGGRPDALIQGSDGNFYGAAQDSMEGSSTPSGGTVFSLTPAGKFTLLHTFAAGTTKTYPNGNLPGQIIQGPDGKLYGYTLFGGIGGCNGYCGGGVLYRVNTNGTGFQILHEFCSETKCADGGTGGVAGMGSDGNLYGASFQGGTGNCGSFYVGCGTIFRVTPSTGAYEVVFNFPGSTDEFPSSFIPASDGTFYGIDLGLQGQSLLHFTPATGKIQSVALNFPTFNGLPSSALSLAFGPNGNLNGIYHIYGRSGLGLFEVPKDGSNLQLFPFYTTVNGGGSPDGLLLASDGNFWVADFNGSTGHGDIITLSPSTGGLLQTLTPFGSRGAVGADPLALIQAKDGTLWGTTDQGGKASAGHFADGTVFSLNAGLPPR
jgi:uncharacterized repeat protein (TIGR03803 family)